METQQLDLPQTKKNKTFRGYCLGLSASLKNKNQDYDHLLNKETSNITLTVENFNTQPVINAYLLLEFYEDDKFLTQSISEFFNLESKDGIQSNIELTLEYPSFFNRDFNLMEMRVSIVEETKFYNKTKLLQIPFQYLNGSFRLSELTVRYSDE